MCLSAVLPTLVRLCGVVLFQRSQTQSPTPPKPPSPSFELGLSNFPPLPGAAGHLKADDLFESRLSGSLLGSSKERVRPMSHAERSVTSRGADFLPGRRPSSLHTWLFPHSEEVQRVSDLQRPHGF